MKIHPNMDLMEFNQFQNNNHFYFVKCKTPQEWFNKNLYQIMHDASIYDVFNRNGVVLDFETFENHSLGEYIGGAYTTFPKSLKHINAVMTFAYYRHPLHDGLETINELNLWYYKLLLPESLTKIESIGIYDYDRPFDVRIAENISIQYRTKPIQI